MSEFNLSEKIEEEWREYEYQDGDHTHKDMALDKWLHVEDVKLAVQQLKEVLDNEYKEAEKHDTNLSQLAKVLIYGFKVQIDKIFGELAK